MHISIQKATFRGGEGTVHLKRKKKPAKSEIFKKRLKNLLQPVREDRLTGQGTSVSQAWKRNPQIWRKTKATRPHIHTWGHDFLTVFVSTSCSYIILILQRTLIKLDNNNQHLQCEAWTLLFHRKRGKQKKKKALHFWYKLHETTQVHEKKKGQT